MSNKEDVLCSQVSADFLSGEGVCWVYVGFWKRAVAAFIDMAFFLTFSLLLKEAFDVGSTGIPSDVSTQLLICFIFLFPPLWFIGFWYYKQATPGKQLLRMKIVDEKTGERPKMSQLIMRLFGYVVSGSFPYNLGWLWIAGHSKKQGLHDIMAGTLVIRCLHVDEESDSSKS